MAAAYLAARMRFVCLKCMFAPRPWGLDVGVDVAMCNGMWAGCRLAENCEMKLGRVCRCSCSKAGTGKIIN